MANKNPLSSQVENSLKKHSNLALLNNNNNNSDI
jgi:hypothetical protein